MSSMDKNQQEMTLMGAKDLARYTFSLLEKMNRIGKEEKVVFVTILSNLHICRTEVDFDLYLDELEIRLYYKNDFGGEIFKFNMMMPSTARETFFNKATESPLLSREDRKAFLKGKHFAVMVGNHLANVILIAKN